MQNSASKHTQTPFGDAWWESFLDKSQNLTKPLVVKDSIDCETRSFYEEAILQLLRELTKIRSSKYGFRIFLESGIMDDNDMGVFYDAPPEPGESFAAWSQRVFGDQKYGMIINSGEKFVPALSDDVALKIEPLLAKVGIPRDGINYTIFIGNYEATPLGIHQDKRGENVMHFHLGPGSKTMYLWDRKPEFMAFLREKGIRRSEVDKLTEYAKKFEFNSGDVFFMPEGVCHIGKQDGFSIGLTIWQYTHTNKKLVENMHDRILASLERDDDEIIQTDPSPIENTDNFNELVKDFKLADGLMKMNYLDLLNDTYRDWRYKVHSNGGYRQALFPREDSIKFSPNDEIEIIRPYKMLTREMPGAEAALLIYVRGHKIQLKNFGCIKELITTLNAGGRHSVKELLAILDPSWDEKIGLYILRELYRHYGIKHFPQPQ